MTMLLIPEPIEAFTGPGANAIELVLTVTDVAGAQYGLLYQTCTVNPIIFDLATPDQVEAFLVQCAMRMLIETSEHAASFADWPVEGQVWEFSMSRTAPGLREDVE